MEPGHEQSQVEKDQNKRNKWLHIRVNIAEYSRIKAYWKTSTSRGFSEYARKVMLNKPVTIKHRNQSLDEFMHEMIKLRSELNSIGNNFNQSVKKLHMLKTIEEIKVWILMNEQTRQSVAAKVEEVKNRINQFSDQWLQ